MGSREAPVLVGMRGSGKSAVGARVAELLGLELVDADAELESRAGTSIAEIFESQGEQGFRRLEEELLLEVLRKTHVVIATGGGAVLHESVRPLLRARLTFWLDGPLRLLASRIASSDRPSLTGRSIVEELDEVYRARRALYEEVSKARIDTEDLTVDEVARRVCELSAQ